MAIQPPDFRNIYLEEKVGRLASAAAHLPYPGADYPVDSYWLAEALANLTAIEAELRAIARSNKGDTN